MSESIEDSFDDFDIAAPIPGALIESLRAFGYDLKTAISDLIDNSITAKARNIWIDAKWAGRNTTICVTDDGQGMTQAELLEAMRPGSKSPTELRNPDDLGRFGLGLKTASFSQCRKLTVRSRKNSASESQYCWDLEYVTKCGEWRVLKGISPDSEIQFNRLADQVTGTAVLWENLDRLVAGDETEDKKALDLFLLQLKEVKQHLAMVFHRFLKGKNSIKIFINDRVIESWDPFLENHEATQRQPQETFIISGDKVLITPFVLPHHSKLSAEEHSLASGPRGWNSHQGFYIYRNYRLLVAGDWLGLGFQKEEHYKLARIQVDIPNSLDDEWAIDVRKARANPPKAIRGELKRIAKLARQTAADIYRHRGKIVARKHSSPDMFIWLNRRKHGKQFYKINRDHPLVKDALNSQKNGSGKLAALLRYLEETVPIPLIVINQRDNPDDEPIPFHGSSSEDVMDVMEEIFESLLRSGLSIDKVLDRLAVMDPFDRYPELIAVLREKTEGKS